VKNALADPRRNLKVVAASCGYASAADMRRVFRRREGCTISEYAKRALPGKISFGATKGEER
jgi:AraC-like DNA-binding protein